RNPRPARRSRARVARIPAVTLPRGLRGIDELRLRCRRRNRRRAHPLKRRGMVTSERELTRAVDLCTADGSLLNPDARGWSRRPLHRANLHGRFGVNKRWDYWAILAGDLVVSSVYSDVDHFGLADVYWADLGT